MKYTEAPYITLAAVLLMTGCAACSRREGIRVVRTDSRSGQNHDECWMIAENRRIRYKATSHQEPCDVNIGDTLMWSGALIFEREGKGSNMYFIQKSEAK
jgi:hypothetical protein